MNNCPVTTDLNRYLAEQERDELRSELIDTKLDELMESGAEVGSALDILMGNSDVGSEGNTLFAADLAAVLLASEAAFGGECIRYFVKLREQVREQVREVAEAETAAAQVKPSDFDGWIY